MALPALHAAAPTAVMLPHWLEPLAKLAGLPTLPFDRGKRGFMKAVRSLRQNRFEQAVLLTPSFSSALLLRLGGVRKRRGTDTDHRSVLLTEAVDRKLLAHTHRSVLYMLLATGDLPGEAPVPQLHITDAARLRFRDLIGTTDPLIGIVPGSNAPSRTWPVDRFAEVADQLSRDGRVVVFGGAGERERTKQVAGDVAIDLGGRTTLPMLAAGLAECEVVISNDTGPLHLAAAVGTRTISLWGAGNPAETGPPAGHPVLRDTRLPCLECVRNRCPRRGKGTILPDAYNECLHLIESDAVIAAARAPFQFPS